MKAVFKSRAVAASVMLAMVATPVLAKSASSLQDLVGANGAGGESQLRARGFEFAKAGDGTSTSKVSYYWNEADKDCVRVETYDGRYTSIRDASHGDCGKGSGNAGAIAAGAIGAAVIGAILLSRKDKNRPNDNGYQHDWQQVEAYNLQSGSLRIFVSPDKNSRVRRDVPEGTQLRNYGCDEYYGESWCEVATLDNRTRGWARDRYLRPSYGNGYYPGQGPGYDRNDIVEVYGVSNALTISSTPDKNGYIVGRINRGAQLRKLDCQYSGGEQWCRVTTLDGRMYGWARERYLRPVGSAGQLPEYGGSGDLVEVVGVSGALTITSDPTRSSYTVGRVSRGTSLRRQGCQYSDGEQWCRVSTLDNRISGWARERYLRQTSSGGYYPGGPGYGGGQMGSIYGVQGMDAVRAIDELRNRGFQNVDSFSSGRTVYGVYYYPPTRLCVQTTANNSRILDIRDIRSHPRCR